MADPCPVSPSALLLLAAPELEQRADRRGRTARGALIPDGFRLHGMEHDPPLPREPWAPTVRSVVQLMRAGAKLRTAGPYVEINLQGEPLVLTDHAANHAALASR